MTKGIQKVILRGRARPQPPDRVESRRISGAEGLDASSRLHNEDRQQGHVDSCATHGCERNSIAHGSAVAVAALGVALDLDLDPSAGDRSDQVRDQDGKLAGAGCAE